MSFLVSLPGAKTLPTDLVEYAEPSVRKHISNAIDYFADGLLKKTPAEANHCKDSAFNEVASAVRLIEVFCVVSSKDASVLLRACEEQGRDLALTYPPKVIEESLKS